MDVSPSMMLSVGGERSFFLATMPGREFHRPNVADVTSW